MYWVEISNFALTKELFSGGDEVIASFKLKNKAIGPGDGQKKELFWIGFTLKTNQAGIQADISNRVELKDVILAYGKSINVSARFTINQEYKESLLNFFESNPGIRALPVAVNVGAAYADGGWTAGATDTYETDAVFLRSYCQPQIADLKIDRATNGIKSDEGIDVLTTLKVGISDTRNLSTLSLNLHYAENETATEDSAYIDLTPNINQLLTGVTDSATLIANTFSNGSNWDFLLVFGDEYESVRAKYTLSRAFANLHLSGKRTGGACFGGFSSSEEGDPKLESYYPGYFYSGIHGINIFSYQEVKTGGRWADNKPLYTKVLALTDATSKINHDIPAPEDIENAWIDPTGSFCIIDGLACYPVSYVSTSGVAVFQAQYRPDINMVRVATQTGTNADFYAKIYYTKTTDQPIEPVQTHAQMVDADDLPVTDKNGLSFYAEEYDDTVYKSAYTGAQIDAGIKNALSALLTTGGAMTGALTLAGDPEVPLGAATKQYVDNLVNNIKLTPGITFIPYVSPEGVISWTNDGGLTNPDPVNIKGDTGAGVVSARIERVV